MKYVRHLSLRHLLAPALAGLLLSGCALGRSVVEIPPPASGAAVEGKVPAKIVEVQDSRKFEASPPNPSTPSLGNPSEINDPKITARAIARKRGGYGQAFGDVVLPEGRTVAGLVRTAAEKALRERGYKIVDEKSPEYANAFPLALNIDQFWAWFTPGLLSVTVEYQSLVTMKGEALVGAGSATVNGYVKYETAAVFESTWADTIRRGVEDLGNKMRDKIKAAPPGS
jgi:uncharacterized lipoprotein YajG